MLWRLISPFIDSVTTQKIVFLNDRNSNDCQAVLHALVAPEQLETVRVIVKVLPTFRVTT